MNQRNDCSILKGILHSSTDPNTHIIFLYSWHHRAGIFLQMRHLDNRPAANALSRVFQDLGLLGISDTYILIFSPAQNSRETHLDKRAKGIIEKGGGYTGRGEGESEA